MLTSHVLAAFHEITLKGGNRGFFERALRNSLVRVLEGLPVAELSVPARVVIRFSRPVPWPVVEERLRAVFGLSWFGPARMAGRSFEELEATVLAAIEEVSASSFAVRCRRSDKRFPLTSAEVERRLGAAVVRETGWPVDLDRPDLTIRVVVQTDGCYLLMRTVQGRGGLPVGTGGRVAVLLSGGIDSPVAAYLAIKRGARALFVHFHSAPFTDEAANRKVRELAALLCRFQGPGRLAVVPFAMFQEAVAAACPTHLLVVLYRRMMLRVAARLARRWRCLALVTGEALNQVASQTLSNLASIDRVAHLPVLRPLVGFDKEEIVRLAEAVGTYETALVPFADSCAYLLPAHPARDTWPGECERAEEVLDIPDWERRLQRDAAVENVQPAAWTSGTETTAPATT
ncbi:MAG TPA: tRNA uracil 4-sulfurtransferase ThiI [Thermoanaerobaculaceae bacterium]|nr:tRNA uracil 4-sulfurtransferase ThiI [Thermoanaerobaculaceae bacterium]